MAAAAAASHADRNAELELSAALDVAFGSDLDDVDNDDEGGVAQHEEDPWLKQTVAPTAKKPKKQPKKAKARAKRAEEGADVVESQPQQQQQQQQKKKRRTTPALPAMPLLELPLPESESMSAEMQAKCVDVQTDMDAAFPSIAAHEDAMLASGRLPALTRITISTVTTNCVLAGPDMGKEEIMRRLADDDVCQFNTDVLGKQPMVNMDKVFQNAVIMRLEDDRTVSNHKSVKIFYPTPTLHITGPRSLSDFLRVAEYSRRLMRQMRGADYVLSDFHIDMINTSFKLGVKLKLHEMVTLLRRSRTRRR